MSDRRPKRRCVTAKNQVPSAIHYVGYVEDDETPEMIMKKFEELERIQKAAEARRTLQQQQQQSQVSAAAGQVDASSAQSPAEGTVTTAASDPLADGASAVPAGANLAGPNLASAPGGQPSAPPPSAPQQEQGPDQSDKLFDEEVLLEVFKQTSIFNVRSALSNNELLLAGGQRAGHDGTGACGDGLLLGAGGRHGDPYGIAYGMEDALFVGGEFGGGGSDMDDDELQCMKGFWSDEDFELGDGGRRNREGARKRKGAGSGKAAAAGQRGEGGEGGSRDSRHTRTAGGGPSGQSRHALKQVVTQYNRDTNALIRRRVGAASGGGGVSGGGSGLVQLRVPPPPLPLSWGRTVRPYQPPESYQPPEPWGSEAVGCAAVSSLAAATSSAAAPPTFAVSDPASTSRGFESLDLPAFPFESALGGKTYVAVMINAGWQPPGAAEAFEAGAEAEVMRRFRSLPIPRLCPRGFVLVWAHKGLLQSVCRALAGWGYVYVENLTWVHLTPANAIAMQPGRHFRRSHSTLLMFRREGEGRDIELRHQRSPDVVFDCIRCLPDGRGWDIPSEVLTTIETMLPGGRGAFLELWAPKGERRPGWDHICEVQLTGLVPTNGDAEADA